MNIYIAGDYGVGYAYWLLDFYKEAVITRDILEADLIMFTGGADISPSIYGEKISRTYWGNEHRDKVEIEVFKKAVELNIPMIGICRGLQLICGLCGGRVIQDVSNHAGCSHNITFKDGFQCVTTSLHHQWYILLNYQKKIIVLKHGALKEDLPSILMEKMNNIHKSLQ